MASPNPHETVKHSVSEYVDGMAHTNGIESFWSMLKRAHKGTFHKISPKHLQRYVSEFAGKHNIRDSGTLAQMRDTVARLVGRNLLCRDLIADNGLDSGARSQVRLAQHGVSQRLRSGALEVNFRIDNGNTASHDFLTQLGKPDDLDWRQSANHARHEFGLGRSDLP